MDEKTWWFVCAVYKSLRPNTPSVPRRLMERRAFLLRAAGRADAEEQARNLTHAQEHTYRNVGNRVVAWKLHKIEQVAELLGQEIEEGAEVYHDFFYEKQPFVRRVE